MKKHSKILNHFKKADPKIYKILKNVDIDEWFNTNTTVSSNKEYFEALCQTIIGQQLSGKAAKTIYSRFVKLFGGKKVIPKNVLKLKDQDIRDAGLSWNKVSYVKDLAKKIEKKEININDIEQMTDEKISSELLKVKGIGPWSVEMFLMFTLKHENVFSHGDLGLKNGIKKVYGIRKPTKERVEKIISKWEPYKTYGAIALWESLEK